MTRVTTAGNFDALWANIAATQQRQADAANRLATQKTGDDLRDYSRSADVLTAMTTLRARAATFQQQNEAVAGKLAVQDTALSRVLEAASATRRAIADALASNQGASLMTDAQGEMRNAVEALNAQYGGSYVFAGGQVATRPVSATDLSDLTQPSTVISDFFKNDRFRTQVRLDERTMITTGLLADEIGTNLLGAYKSLQSFQEGASGPFTQPLTPSQQAFLEQQLQAWDAVQQNLIEHVASNGLIQQRLEDVGADVGARADQLDQILGGLTGADPAEAAAALQQAQISVQAAARVFATLRDASLTSILS